jgi:hypothetical protein
MGAQSGVGASPHPTPVGEILRKLNFYEVKMRTSSKIANLEGQDIELCTAPRSGMGDTGNKHAASVTGKQPTIFIKLGGTQSQFGRFGEEVNCLAPPVTALSTTSQDKETAGPEQQAGWTTNSPHQLTTRKIPSSTTQPTLQLRHLTSENATNVRCGNNASL